MLTDTAFFRAAQNGSHDEMTANYGEFIEKVVEVCGCADGKPQAFATLVYTEIELDSLKPDSDPAMKLIAKAKQFLNDMQTMLEQLPITEVKSASPTSKASGLSWTGDITSLVELVYGLQEMRCINDGKLSIEELGNRLFSALGMEPRIYTRLYINIKKRSLRNGVRTYFLTEMRQMLDERIDQDIHISLRRK